MTKPTVAFCNFAKVPEMIKISDKNNKTELDQCVTILKLMKTTTKGLNY